MRIVNNNKGQSFEIKPSKRGEDIQKSIGGLLGAIMAKSYDKAYALHGDTSRIKNK